MKLQNYFRKNLNNLKNEGVKFDQIELNDFFCNKNKCKVGNSKGSYYSDKHHLSIYGARSIKNKIKKYLEK